MHRLFRWILPVFVSAGLVAWLVVRISPANLVRTAEGLNWPALTALTIALIVSVYLWDVVCVRWLYRLPDRQLSFGQAAEARANSYLWSALNFEVGQGVMAWRIAQIQKASLLQSLSRCVLLALHDLVLLLVLSFIGTMIDPAPQTRLVPIALAVSLAVVASLVIGWKLLPPSKRERIVNTRWGNWLAWWQGRHSVVLVALRLVYYGIMIVYAAVALRVCGVVRDFEVICGVIPLVFLADALPSVSGFGTRHAAFESLLELDPQEQAVVFHFSTFWSAGLMIGRASIGLVDWWLVPRREAHA